MPQVSAIKTLGADDKAWLDAELIRRGFSGYKVIEELCAERGLEVSKSALQRYGKPFQERLDAVKMITEQARAVVDSAPDEDGAVNEALMRLIQEKLFTVVVEAELSTGDISKVTKAIADLGRASVTQKKMAAEVRKKALEEAADAAVAEAKKAGMSDGGIDSIRKAIKGEL